VINGTLPSNAWLALCNNEFSQEFSTPNTYQAPGVVRVPELRTSDEGD